MSKRKTTKTNHYVRYGIFSIEEVLEGVGFKSPKKEFTADDGTVYLAKMDSIRLRTFKEHGTKCVCCGVEGKYFALENMGNCVTPHFNLYGINEDGEEVLMTKDHIIPKSKGGKNIVSNMQTMCVVCNFEKSNIDNDEFFKSKVVK